MKIKLICLFFFLLTFYIGAQNFWETTNGPFAGAVRTLAIGDNGDIFVGTDGSGVYHSTNNGNSWIPKNTGMTFSHVYSIVIGNDGHVYAGTYDSGIYRSTDNGNSWNQVNNGLTNIQVLSLAITNSGSILAGTNGSGIYRSTDGGNNWINTGNTRYNYALAANGKANNAIFAGAKTAIYRSTNDGNSWDQMINYNFIFGNFTSIAINNSGNIFVGSNYALAVLRSTDNGNNWSQMAQATNNSFKNTHVFSIAINSNGHIFAGTESNGVFRSTDNGDTWTQINNGLTGTSIPSLNINRNGYIFAGTNNGEVLRSINTTSVAPPKPSLIFPANNSAQISLTPILSWSQEPGADVYRLEVNTKSNFSGTVIYDQDDLITNSKQIGGLLDNTIYYWRVTASTNIGQLSEVSDTFSFTTDKVLLSTESNGAMSVSISPILSWFETAGASKYRLEVNTNSNFNGTVIFDNSEITETSQSLSGLNYNTQYFWRVTASSNILNKITVSDVYNFTTKLESVNLLEPSNNLNDVSLSPTLSWSEVSGANKYRLEVNSNSQFTGTVVYDVETDMNTSYTLEELSEEFTYYWRVTALNNAGNSSDVSSIFNFTTISVTEISEFNTLIPTDYEIFQNYPNPFNPNTMIRYALPFVSKVKINIYSVLGQKLEELVNSVESAGYHEIIFNSGKLASGVYLYTITAVSNDGKSKFFDTKKLLLLK